MYIYLKAGDGPKALKLLGEIGEADGVMQDSVGAIIIGIRATDNADDGKILAVGSCDGVEDAEPAHGEGDDAGSDAVRAGVAIGGVPCVELVAASYIGEAGLGDQMVKKREIEVPRDGEDVADADLDEAAGEVAAEGGLPCRRRWYHRVAGGRWNAPNTAV